MEPKFLMGYPNGVKELGPASFNSKFSHEIAFMKGTMATG